MNHLDAIFIDKKIRKLKSEQDSLDYELYIHKIGLAGVLNCAATMVLTTYFPPLGILYGIFGINHVLHFYHESQYSEELIDEKDAEIRMLQQR